MKIKAYPEIHMEGFMSIEKDMKISGQIVDFGIQIAEDGRVWICIDGQALIRFRPKERKKV